MKQSTKGTTAVTRPARLSREHIPIGSGRKWTAFHFDGKRLYVATPMVMFREPGYFAYTEAAITAAFPGVELVWGAREFSSNDDWRARWPQVLESVEGMVFASDVRRVIGLGVYTEVADAVAAGKPVGYHIRDNLICTVDHVEITILDPEDRVRYAKVRVKR